MKVNGQWGHKFSEFACLKKIYTEHYLKNKKNINWCKTSFDGYSTLWMRRHVNIRLHIDNDTC